MSLMEREEFGIEKIIQELQEAVDLGDAPKRGPFAIFVRKEYLVEAIALLRTHQDNQPNEPLTLEELRGMYGKPVWVEYEDGKDGRWGLVGIGEITFPAGEFCVICEDGFGQSWKAYRRPPKEET